MDFKLSDATVLIRNSAREYLKEKCPSSFVKEMIEDETGFSRTMWKEMAELGWLGMLFDDEYGGSGGSEGSFFDFFTVLVELGRVLLPSPLFPSAIVSGLILDQAGDEELKRSLLPSIVEGDTILTAALLDEGGEYDFHDPKLQVVEGPGGWYTVTGTRILVPYAHVADAVIVCGAVQGSESGGPTLFKIGTQTPGQELVPLATLSGEKTFAVTYENATVSSDDIIGEVGKGAEYLERVLPKLIVLKCGEMLGGLERVVELTVNHVKERRQFGAPLGALQAVQHHCADMETFLASTRLITCQAAFLVGEGLPCDKEVAMAKAWCSDAYKKCTWIGQQLHGGVGFTDEYDIHLYYKHAKESELMFGDSRYHRWKVADRMGL
ncbi:acyl-CoA dehydrogenase family protein [Thermodesulfobacteriota bacterium]